MAGATVQLEVTGGGGTLSSTPSNSEAITDSYGEAAWSWTLGSDPGTTNTLQVTGVGIADPDDPGPFSDVANQVCADLFVRTLEFTALTSIENGSFETPVIRGDWSWQTFSHVPGWAVDWTDEVDLSGAPDPALLEFQKTGVVAPSVDGVQLVELDSDYSEGSGNNQENGEAANVKISKNLEVVGGVTYVLSYSWRARTASDKLLVTFGPESATHGPGGASGDWSTETLTFTPAVGGTVPLSFEEDGPADSFGTLLDAVTVTISGNQE